MTISPHLPRSKLLAQTFDKNVLLYLDMTLSAFPGVAVAGPLKIVFLLEIRASQLRKLPPPLSPSRPGADRQHSAYLIVRRLSSRLQSYRSLCRDSTIRCTSVIR